MKIESSNKTASTPLTTRAQSTGKASSAGKDDVQLSALSAQLSAADDEQSFDAARVSEIKQAIADGRFTIMMPHPERVFRTVQMSWHPDSLGEDSPWMRMFRNARKWVG